MMHSHKNMLVSYDLHRQSRFEELATIRRFPIFTVITIILKAFIEQLIPTYVMLTYVNY